MYTVFFAVPALLCAVGKPFGCVLVGTCLVPRRYDASGTRVVFEAMFPTDTADFEAIPEVVVTGPVSLCGQTLNNGGLLSVWFNDEDCLAFVRDAYFLNR